MMNNKKNQVIGGGLLMVLLFFTGACFNPSINDSEGGVATDSTDIIDSAQIDSITAKFTDQEGIRVVAGNSIGDFLIDQEVEESNLFNRLGEVDSSDAAMCKSWSMWYLSGGEGVNEPAQEFDVYAACDPDIDMKKSIQVMRLSNVDFSMDNGISFGTDLSVLKESYPDVVELVFTDTLNNTMIQLYDDVAAGIAFEIREDEVRAVLVHMPDQSIENMYMPFYKK